MKRLIDFKTLCKLCTYNGENHQEYGRLCCGRDACLYPQKRGLKKAQTCSIWQAMKNK